MKLAAVPGDDRGIQGNAARCAVELALLDAFGRAFGEPLTQRHGTGRPGPVPVPRPGAVQRRHRQPAGLEEAALPARVPARRLHAGEGEGRHRGAGRREADEDASAAGSAGRSTCASTRTRRGRRRRPRPASANWSRSASRASSSRCRTRTSRASPTCASRSRRRSCSTNRCAARSTPSGRSQDGWCDLFNLRLSKCGGFIPSLRLAQLAKRHGLGYQLGCQVGETAILSAAGRHFATSVDGIRYLEGSYDRHLVWESLSRGRPHVPPRRVGAGAGRQRPRRRRIDPARRGLGDAAEGDADWTVPLTPRGGSDGYPCRSARRARSSRLTFRASDGYPFYFRHYPAPATPAARLVFVHGIRSHGGWYARSCRRVRRGRVRRVLPRPPRGRAEHRPPRRRPELPPAPRRRGRVRAAPSRRARVAAGVRRAASRGAGSSRSGCRTASPGLVDGLVLLCPGSCRRSHRRCRSGADRGRAACSGRGSSSRSR